VDGKIQYWGEGEVKASEEETAHVVINVWEIHRPG
jgi:hypothetical protein